MSSDALFWAIKQPVGDVYEKAVLWILANLANKKRNHAAWPSLATIAKEARISKRKAQDAVKALIARKLIEPQGPTVRRRYRMMLENDFSPPPPPSVDHGTGRIEHGATCVDHGTPCHQSYDHPVRDTCADAPEKSHRAGQRAGGGPSRAGTRPPAQRTKPADKQSPEQRWNDRVELFKEDGFWTAGWGPRPDASGGWLAPEEVLRGLGYGEET